MDQCHRVESPETNLRRYSQLFFDKGERQFNGEGIIFTTNEAITTRNSHVEKKESRRRSYNVHKIN